MEFLPFPEMHGTDAPLKAGFFFGVVWSLWLETSSKCAPLGSLLSMIQMSAQRALPLRYLPWQPPEGTW